MATVTDAEGKEVGRKQQVAALIAAGIDEIYAGFIVALERGEIHGDVIEVDEQGNEVTPAAGETGA